MKYLVYSKDNVCMAKGICKSIEDAEPFMSFYDAVEEVAEEEYKTIPIPSVKVNGVWEKTDNVPAIEWPEATEETGETGDNDNVTWAELDAAYNEGRDRAYDQ